MSGTPKTKAEKNPSVLAEPRTKVTPAMAQAGKEALLAHYLDLVSSQIDVFPRIASIVYAAMQGARPLSDVPSSRNRRLR